MWLIFSLSIYPFIGCHFLVCRIYSYLVNIMHELIFFSFNADELGAIIIYTKIYLKALNTCPCIWPSIYCDGVLTILGFYTVIFWCVFVYVYWCILVTCVNLVFPFPICSTSSFFVRGIIPDSGALLVF